MLAEIKRLLANIVSIGTVSQTKSDDGKALVKVKIIDRETDFLPLVSFSNGFKRHFIPARIGEQVVVFSPFGEASSGFVIRSIFNTAVKEPNGSNNTTEVIEYEDGTKFSYDTASKTLKVECVGLINVVCKNATITADTTKITSEVEIVGSLKVSEQITGQNGISITGGAAIGGASFDCDISAKDISSSGTISDSKGDLTNHTNNGYIRD